jgi:hypothetical protein
MQWSLHVHLVFTQRRFSSGRGSNHPDFSCVSHAEHDSELIPIQKGMGPKGQPLPPSLMAISTHHVSNLRPPLFKARSFRHRDYSTVAVAMFPSNTGLLDPYFPGTRTWLVYHGGVTPLYPLWRPSPATWLRSAVRKGTGLPSRLVHYQRKDEIARRPLSERAKSILSPISGRRRRLLERLACTPILLPVELLDLLHARMSA